MLQSYFPLFLLIYEFCSYLSNDMYLPALVLLEQEFGTTQTLVQLSITIWYMGMALPQLAMGMLSDRFGRRVVLLVGGAVFLLSTMGCAIATSIESFLVFRFFEGVGVCSLLVSGYAAIHESHDDAKAIHIIAWMGFLTVFAPMFGPLAGGYILAVASWRAIFWLIFLCCLAAIWALYYIMPETNTSHSASVESKVFYRLLKNRQFIMSSVVLGCLIGVLIAWIATSPFLLMQSKGLTGTEFGWAQVPIFAAYAIATRFVTPLYERLGVKRQLRVGFGIILFAVLVLVFNHLIGCSYWHCFIVPMSIYALGFGLVSALLNRRVFTASDENRGAVTAMFYVVEMGIASIASFSLCLAIR